MSSWCGSSPRIEAPSEMSGGILPPLCIRGAMKTRVFQQPANPSPGVLSKSSNLRTEGSRMIPLLCGDAPKGPCSVVRPAGLNRARRGAARSALVAALLSCGFVRAAEPDGSVAKITSLQNQVETRGAQQTAWNPSTLNQSLAGHDRVRTGGASRASILYSDQTLHRLNEKSEVEILPPAGGSPGLLKILSGQHYFSSRTPKDYGRIETPAVTAAIKGTEFMVDVADDSSTTITMLEGTVVAANEQGNLEVHQGEQAYVEPGKAPVKRILVPT